MAVIITNMDMPSCCHFCHYRNCERFNKYWGNSITDYRTDRHKDCPLKSADDYKSILDKIRAEIEQLPTSYVEIFTRHSGVKYRDMVDLGEVTRILDKYKAENEGKK